MRLNVLAVMARCAYGISVMLLVDEAEAEKVYARESERSNEVMEDWMCAVRSKHSAQLLEHRFQP